MDKITKSICAEGINEMNNPNNSSPTDVNEATPDQSFADCYEIHLQGWLNACWSEWLDGMEIRHVGDRTTILSGAVVDQAALYGLLLKIRDLNLKLVLVKKL
jgi:hypothetical protein